MTYCNSEIGEPTYGGSDAPVMGQRGHQVKEVHPCTGMSAGRHGSSSVSLAFQMMLQCQGNAKMLTNTIDANGLG